MKLDLNLLKNKISELKACCGCNPSVEIEVGVEKEDKDSCDKYSYDIQYLKEEVKYLYRFLSSLEESFYKHMSDGHLPKIPSAEKLKEVLEILNLDKEYKVETKTIYASNGLKEKTILNIYPNETKSI